MYRFIVFVAFISGLTSCSSTKISSHCGKKCEMVTLYYLPDCKEIKGYVNFDKTGLQRVFQHELPLEFRKDSLRVCIKYESVGVGILMSDCIQSEIIQIKCISSGTDEQQVSN